MRRREDIEKERYEICNINALEVLLDIREILDDMREDIRNWKK